MNPRVYLCGPITGQSYGSATSWREYADCRLGENNMTAVSPLRGKEYLAHLETISGHGREYAHLGVLSTPRAVMTRDRFDATHCDALLAYFVGATQVSIGSVMELAWADAHRIPIVAVMPAEGGPHDHMMIHEAVGFRVDDLDEAIDILKVLLEPYTANPLHIGGLTKWQASTK